MQKIFEKSHIKHISLAKSILLNQKFEKTREDTEYKNNKMCL